MLPSPSPTGPYYGVPVTRRLARFYLALALFGASAPSGSALADDWSITRDRRPSRPTPPRPTSPRPVRSRPEPRAAADRHLAAALSDPASDVFVDHLVARRRNAEGDLEKLRGELEALGTLEARVLRARLDAEEGDLEAARTKLESLDREAADSALPARTLAAIERRFGELGRVTAWYDRALERTKEPARREAILREKVAIHLDRGELDEARGAMEELFRTRPRDVSLRLEWARELATRHRRDEALTAYEEALALSRGDARVAMPIRVELARARLAAGDAEGALAEVERAHRAPGSAPFRGALLEIEIAAHRTLGRLDALANSLATRGDVESTVARAKILDELGDDEGALLAYEVAIRKRPRDRDLRVALARLHARLGRLDRVIDEYRRLVRESGGDPTFVRELALIYERMGRRRDAEAMLAELLRAFPRSAPLARVNAELRERFGDRDALRAALLHWKRVAPDDPEPRIALGAELLAAGDRKRALDEFRGLLDVGGDPVEARLELARVLADHDLLDEAEEAMRPIAARAPEHLEIARQLASIYERPRATESTSLRAERNRQAEAHWRMVLSHPQADEEARREARRHVVQLWRTSGRLEHEIAALEREREQRPDDLTVARLLAEAYLAHDPHSPERALAILERAAHEGRDVEALTQLARVRRQAGDREGEIEILERLVQLDARRSSRHLDRLVELSLELYRDEDALRYAAEAARRAPHDAAAHRRLAALHRERRELDEAVAAYRRALSLDDSHVPTIQALAALELARGNVDESLDLQLRVVRSSPDDELVRAAGHAALRLANTRARLEVVESTLTPLSVAQGARPVFRRLLLPVYEAEVGMGVDRVALGKRAAKVLVETLFEGDAGSKRRALHLLEQLRPEAAARPLATFATQEGDGELRARALVARAAIPKPLQASEIEPLLASPDRRVRLASAWAVHRLGPESLRAGLLDAEDPAVRALAALSFAARPNAHVASTLASRFAKDMNAEVKMAASIALGRLGEARHRSSVARAAVAGTPRERRAALFALAGSRSKEALDAIALGFFDESPLVRKTARLAAHTASPPAIELEVTGLPRVGDLLEGLVELELPVDGSLAHVVPALEEAARLMIAGPVERKLAVLHVLDAGEGLDEDTARALVAAVEGDVARLLESEDARVRRAATSLLVSRSSRLAPAALAAALERGDEEVARVALERHGPFLDEGTRPRVEAAALDAGRWPLRRAAVALLRRQHPSASRVTLERVLLTDTHAIVRAEAAKALAEVEGAEAALERASRLDASEAVQEAARRALASTFD